MNIFVEASGSLVSSYLIKAIQECGHRAIGSDVVECVSGRYLADDFLVVPRKNDPLLWKKIDTLLQEKEIEVVIPSFDETLIGWAQRKGFYSSLGVKVIISNEEVMKIFQDKYLTHKFFEECEILNPETSLFNEYRLVKPRFGRGGEGIELDPKKNIDMEGMISQEYIEGVEYTIDVFCEEDGNPLYIVPRKRLGIVDGKSTAGIVVCHDGIIESVKSICSKAHFIGPINLQCIENSTGELFFIEINPRIAGGMALAFAATENWIGLCIDSLVKGNKRQPEEVRYGLRMFRYYSEIFV